MVLCQLLCTGALKRERMQPDSSPPFREAARQDTASAKVHRQPSDEAFQAKYNQREQAWERGQPSRPTARRDQRVWSAVKSESF